MLRVLHCRALCWARSKHCSAKVLFFGADTNKKPLWKEFQTWIWALRFLFEAQFDPLLGPNLSISWSHLPVSAQPTGVLYTCHLLHQQKHPLSSISDLHTVTQTPSQVARRWEQTLAAASGGWCSSCTDAPTPCPVVRNSRAALDLQYPNHLPSWQWQITALRGSD